LPFALQAIGEAHWGASVRFLTVVQVPVAQLKQGSVQASGQQTPSVQKPEAHSVASPQTLPFALLAGAGGAPQAPAPLQVVAPHSPSGSVPVR
jgi:hypothetical protein